MTTEELLGHDLSASHAELLELTFDAVIVRDFDSDAIRYWNRGAEELYGYAREDVLGKVSHIVLQTKHPIEIGEAKSALLRSGRWEGELVHTKSDGTKIVVLSRWALQTDGNRPSLILETNTDITERRASEEALRQSEELYRTIVSTANEGVWLIDLEGRTMYANVRMTEMLGYTSDELAQLSVIDCAFPEDSEKHRERIGANLSGRLEQFDTRFRRKDGSELLVLACTSAVRGSNGEIIGALGMFTDITERVRADRERIELLQREQRARVEAEEAEQRLTLLAEASALLASSLDYETTLKSLAQAVVPAIADWAAVDLVEEDGGVRRVAVMHQDPSKIEAARRVDELAPYNPDSPIGVANVLRTGEAELMSQLPGQFFESLIDNPELLEVVLEIGLSSWMIVPLAARGRLLGTLTLAASESGKHYTSEDLALADVLARRAALAVDNARLYYEAQRVAGERSAILSQMTDGLMMCDMTRRVTFVNEAAKRIYGRDFVGRSLDEYQESSQIRDSRGVAYPIDDLPLQRALAYGEVTMDAEARLTRQDGSEVIIERSATPIIAPDGTQVGAILVIRDVTEQKTLEQEKEQFLSAAAHDLKTPLTSLMGMAQVLQRRIKREEQATPAELLDGLNRIERNASRMTALINELLDLSQLEMGQALELRRQRTDLIALASASINALSSNGPGRRIELEAKASDVTGSWDSSRLERVISNLVSNAMKYSAEGTAVAVSVDKEQRGGQEWAILAVRDEGIGIPQEDLDNVFDRFHRGRNVGSGVLGTGIGLAAAKQIIEQHEGTIDVESEEGKGSTFTVRLPLTRAPSDQETGANEE